MSSCPACARPVALARPTCLYCGAALPPDVVAQAEAARRALADGAPAERGVGVGPVAPAGRGESAGTAAASGDRAVVAIDASGADAQRLAHALGLPAYEAGQRARRRGWQLLRVGAPLDGRETAALLEAGVEIEALSESEVRAAAQPLVAGGGGWRDGRLRLHTDERDVTLAAGELLLVVRGPIARQLEAAPARSRGRMVVGAAWRHLPAGLEPGERFHLHRRGDPRPLELDPQTFEFGSARPAEAPALALARWAEALAGGAPIDEGFRHVTPALGPAQAERGAAADVVETLRRTRGRAAAARAVHDNLAQFRFYSAWRGLVERRRG